MLEQSILFFVFILSGEQSFYCEEENLLCDEFMCSNVFCSLSRRVPEVLFGFAVRWDAFRKFYLALQSVETSSESFIWVCSPSRCVPEVLFGFAICRDEFRMFENDESLM